MSIAADKNLYVTGAGPESDAPEDRNPLRLPIGFHLEADTSTHLLHGLVKMINCVGLLGMAVVKMIRGSV